MNLPHKISITGKPLRALYFLVAFVFCLVGWSQESGPEKISPSMRLTYHIVDGIKSIKVELNRKEGRKFIPIGNVIVNLYNAEVKKYDPATAEGWLGNLVTDDEGTGVFRLTGKFNELTAGQRSFNFIVSLGSDPVYEDTQEEIAVNEVLLDLSGEAADSLTTVVARLSAYSDSVPVPMAESEVKLLVKRSLGALPFSEEGAVTDEKGAVSGIIPVDLPGERGGKITVVARYEDTENDGVIEVTRTFPWKIPPRESVWDGRTLWASGSNAPIALVAVSVSLIVLIWGTILYLVTLLFRIKRMGRNSWNKLSNEKTNMS